MALEDAALTGVDPGRQELAEAAQAYQKAPARLKAAILAAADRGERPRDIVRAIGYVYTYDYVARLVRERRASRGARTAA